MPLDSFINLSHVMGIEQCTWRRPFFRQPLSVFLVEIPAVPDGLAVIHQHIKLLSHEAVKVLHSMLFVLCKVRQRLFLT